MCFVWDLMIFSERREHRVFTTLLQMVPGLEARLMEGTEEDLVMIAELVSFFLLILLVRLTQH